MLVPINNINCSDRIRGVTTATVSGLAESIREVGLLNPITVGRTTVVRGGTAQDGYILIGGLHRLEAAKSLGWDEIEATVTDLSGPAAVIAECDENLCGPNLSAAERALFTRRRKEAYEALHPETRHGGDRGSSRQFGDMDRFTADTAKRTGQSERKVQRDAERGKRVADDVLAEIAGTKLDTGKVLDKLATVPKEQQRAKVEELRAAKAARLLAEEESKEARKSNRDTDKLITERRIEAIKEFLAARLDLTELHDLGEMFAGICDPVSKSLMREAA